MAMGHERVAGSVFWGWVIAFAMIAVPVFAQTQAGDASPATTPAVASAEPVAKSPPAASPTSTATLPPAEPATKPKSVAVAWLNAGLGVAPEVVTRESPRDAVAGFLAAGRTQEWMLAAHYLNLSKLNAAQQRRNGPELAQRLFYVLETQVWFDLEMIPDEPTGATDKTPAQTEVQVASIPLRSGMQGIRLSRVADAQGKQVWVVSTATVQAIDDLHDRYGPSPLVEKLPAWARANAVLGLESWQWAGLVVLVGVCWFFGWIVEKTAVAIARSWSRRRKTELNPELTRLIEGPGGMISGLVLVVLALPWLRLVASAEQVIGRIVTILVILVVTRAGVRLVNYGASLVEAHGQEHLTDDVRRRAVATRVTTARRITAALVWIVGIALAMMQFTVVRNLGWSLLGSAGIAGAILGFAAQKTFSNVFAGIIISLTQPIRIGDTVVVEKEFGVIEEIGSTHVVVKLWDLRRLVLPIVYFLDSPFENWTRTGQELVGVVRLQADYRVKVEEIREELKRMLEGEALWNGKKAAVIVEDMTADAVTVRITLSADDSDKLFDLRSKVREQMLAFLQQEPWRLPTRRFEAISKQGG